MKVYRIQKEDNYSMFGEGAYRNSHTIGEELCNAHCIDSHPPAWRDIDNFTTDMFLACPSYKALTWWFDGYMDDLLKAGFSVVEYEVKRVCESKSGKQVGILKEDVLSKTIICGGVNKINLNLELV